MFTLQIMSDHHICHHNGVHVMTSHDISLKARSTSCSHFDMVAILTQSLMFGLSDEFHTWSAIYAESGCFTTSIVTRLNSSVRLDFYYHKARQQRLTHPFQLVTCR